MNVVTYVTSPLLYKTLIVNQMWHPLKSCLTCPSSMVRAVRWKGWCWVAFSLCLLPSPAIFVDLNDNIWIYVYRVISWTFSCNVSLKYIYCTGISVCYYYDIIVLYGANCLIFKSKYEQYVLFNHKYENCYTISIHLCAFANKGIRQIYVCCFYSMFLNFYRWWKWQF